VSDVIHTRAFDDARAVRTFASLARLVETNTKAILADPLPHLKSAGDEIHRLRTALIAAGDALAGMPVWVPDGAPIAYHNPLADIELRNRKARKVITAALNHPRDPA
jgi:hypothetical protein